MASSKTNPPTHLQRVFANGVMAEAQAREIIIRLGDQRIPIIPWKGVLFQHWLYDDPMERPMSDLDMIVRKQDWGNVVRILRKIGYNPDPRLKNRIGYAAYFEMGFVRPGSLPLELHCSVASGVGAYRLCKSIFTNPVQSGTNYDYENVHVPTVEQTLVALAHHFREHGLQVSPHQLDDVRRLVDRHTPDPGQVALLANEYDAAFSLILLLQAAGRPEAADATLRAPGPVRRRLLSALTRTGKTGMVPRIPGLGGRQGERIWRSMLYLWLLRDSVGEAAASHNDHLRFFLRAIVRELKRLPDREEHLHDDF